MIGSGKMLIELRKIGDVDTIHDEDRIHCSEWMGLVTHGSLMTGLMMRFGLGGPEYYMMFIATSLSPM